jgi:lysophospholipase L1-like esterase
MSTSRRTAALAVAALATLVLAGCSGSDGGSDASSTPPTASTSGSASASTTSSAPVAGTSAPVQPALPAGANTYVSIGDSYAAGYQPTAKGKGATTRNGFAYQAVTGAKSRGYDLHLVNFGCSGATTASALREAGCSDRDLGPGAQSYSQPQITAAAAYLRAHRGKVALVTVSLGGNDITGCATAADATTCVTNTLRIVAGNIGSIATTLRTAAGPSTRIVGLTYPDIFLGAELSTDPEKRKLANLSVLAFQALINPQLKSAYAKGGATFADVTTATGAFGPLTQTTNLPPYGTIPVPVAKICQLTYFCEFQDIHPRTNGYKIIADLVVQALPKR